MNRDWSSDKLSWLLVNLIGGTAVIGSYIIGFLSSPNASTALWGGVPESVRPVYTAGMLLAAAGYLAVFAYFLRIGGHELQIAGRNGFPLLTGLYLLILVPSILWMPLSLWALSSSSQVLAWLVRLDLALVGFGAAGSLWAVLRSKPRRSPRSHSLVVIGAAAVCLQTVGLDALIWSILFRV